MSQSNYLHLEDCNVLNETPNAMLVEWEEVEYWFPKSQMIVGELKAGDQKVTVTITKWIAKQKGIEYDD